MFVNSKLYVFTIRIKNIKKLIQYAKDEIVKTQGVPKVAIIPSI